MRVSTVDWRGGSLLHGVAVVVEEDEERGEVGDARGRAVVRTRTRSSPKRVGVRPKARAARSSA
jgi:hypothetical protein